MAIVSAVEIPIESKDACEAVRKWLEILKTQIVQFDGLQINIGLSSMANKGVLVHLAERLPGSALGFTSFSSSQRALTAAEFLREPSQSHWSYQGILTEHMSVQMSFKLIGELITCKSQAIRSTTFFLDCKKLRWKSSPIGSSGNLHLIDFKAFQRKQRFSLTASLNCPDYEPKSPDIIASLKRVLECTNIPFPKGIISKVADEGRDEVSLAKTRLIGQVCFDEAVETAADGLDQESNSQWMKTALASDEAVKLRMEQWGSGNSERINLASLAKRVIKSELPKLVFESSGAEQIRFKKPLTDTTETIVIFSKSLPRLGKAFTIEIGIRPTDPSLTGIQFKANLFRLERTREERSWIYVTSKEAEASIRIAVEAIKNLLPIFETAIRTFFSPWPTDYPKQLKRNGNLTAKQAVELALPFVADQSPDMRLIRLGIRTRSLPVRDIEGPEVSIDGRIQENGMWWLHFHSKTKDQSIEVCVPAIGRIRVLDHGNQYKKPNSRHILSAIDGIWIDSNEAFAIAEKNGGAKCRAESKLFGICAKLDSLKWQSPFWEVMYLATDERGQNDFTAVIDAISGDLKTSAK